MVRNKSWLLRLPQSLTEHQKKTALRFIGFTKDKKSAPEGTKSRLVVNGAEQKHEDYDIYSEISASTGRRSNLFAVAAYAAANNWACMSFDFEQAFTISKIHENDDSEKIICKLDRVYVQILRKVDPTTNYDEYVA